MNALADRVRILSGILAGIDRWRDVGDAVSAVNNRDEALDRIQELLGLDAEQAAAILDQPIARLVQADVLRMRTELARAREQLADEDGGK